MSTLLGFDRTCAIEIEDALGDYDGKRFLREISRMTNFSEARTSHIELPTLCFLHKWIGFTLFPKYDIRQIRQGDAMLLYAAVKRIKVSPVKMWVDHWTDIPG